MIRLDNIKDYTENNRIEAKKAAGGLPHSLWETYSAFANTFGGIILLGVEELRDHTLQVSGIADPEAMVTKFWEILEDRRYVSNNILISENVRIQTVEDKKIIAIEIPRAHHTVKPVYLGEDPYSGAYRRCGEGDYHCTREEVMNMLRDRESGRDERLLPRFSISALDSETVARYRERFGQVHPKHAWLSLPQELFLEKISAVKLCEKGLAPTAAGLLMFGQETEIIQEFPGYFLDYQEKQEQSYELGDRVLSGSGDWSGNLCDFYFCVYRKIAAAIALPLGNSYGEKNPLQEALREALTNAVIHADYDGGHGLVIEKDQNSITITNPGRFRMNPDYAITDSVADPRNRTLARMFALVGVGHGEGGGLRSIQTVWEKYHMGKPKLQEQFNPDIVTLKLTVKMDLLDTVQIREAILSYLTEHIEVDEARLARELKFPKDRVEQALQTLLVNEAVVPGANGNYRLKR